MAIIIPPGQGQRHPKRSPSLGYDARSAALYYARKRRRARASGGAPTFTPSDIAGLQYWTDASNAAAFSLSGSEVSIWDNEVDGGLSGWSGTPGARPTRVVDESKDAVFFNASVTQQVLSQGDFAGIQNIWDGGGLLVLVAKINNVAVTSPRLFQKGSLNDVQYSSPSGANTDLIMNKAFSTTTGTWRANNVADRLPVGTYTIIEIAYDSDDVANNPTVDFTLAPATVNETSAPVGTRSSDAGQAMFLGNASNGVRGADMYVREFFLFNASPSAQELSDLRTYLSSKWAIPLP